jgi:hypothetical protein
VIPLACLFVIPGGVEESLTVQQIAIRDISSSLDMTKRVEAMNLSHAHPDCPDKFKSSLGAHEVAENIATGLRDVFTDAKIDIVPMADGGEGTAEVICDALVVPG